MIGFKTKIKMTPEELKRKAHGAAITNLGHAGGAMRLIAIKSIKQTPKHQPSSPGTPPHTRRGLFKRAIIYEVMRHRLYVIVGPTANVVGPAAAAHEFGGRFRGDNYPARPFVGPAFEKIKPRLAPMWSNSIK